MKPTTEIPSVTRVEVVLEQVRAFADEQAFTGLAVRLLIEVGSYVCVAANILPPPPHRWNRHESVVV